MIESALVKSRFEEADKSILRGAIGPGQTCGRHQAGAKFSHDAFPHGRIVGDAIQIRAVEHNAGCGGGT
jgi:hypothetical protein